MTPQEIEIITKNPFLVPRMATRIECTVARAMRNALRPDPVEPVAFDECNQRKYQAALARAEARQARLIKALTGKQMSVDEVAAEIGVKRSTVRRDFLSLEAGGRIKRVWLTEKKCEWVAV